MTKADPKLLSRLPRTEGRVAGASRMLRDQRYAIEERAQDIIKNVEKLSGHIGKYEDYYQKLGKTLETTVNHYNAGYKELNKIDKDVVRITGESVGIDVLTIDKPQKVEDME